MSISLVIPIRSDTGRPALGAIQKSPTGERGIKAHPSLVSTTIFTIFWFSFALPAPRSDREGAGVLGDWRRTGASRLPLAARVSLFPVLAARRLRRTNWAAEVRRLSAEAVAPESEQRSWRPGELGVAAQEGRRRESF